MHRTLVVLVCTCALLVLVCPPASALTPTLTLKWQKVGCVGGEWCDTGWYSSPAVADIDGDGQQDVVWSSYAIWAVDGATGNVKWQVASGHDVSEPNASNVGRTWPGIVIADINKDGQSEIVTAHGGGWVSVYDHDGRFLPGWPQRPAANELRGLAVYDLDGNGYLEIAVTVARSGNYNNIWVYRYDGTKYAPGWPQLSDGCCAYGVYNANLAIGDLDKDGRGELVVPSDVHYIAGFNDDAGRIPANSMYGAKKWPEVGVWVDLAAELRGWGYCETERRPNFAGGPADIVDLNGDGVNEVVAVGNVHRCDTDPYTDLYNGPYVFNADRSRFNSGGFDWTTVPTNTGAPLSEDYNRIENCQPNPVAADIDGDGRMEILYASYDGRMHCFWLDKREHHNWPYSVNKKPGSETFWRFGSEPVVADLDNNGEAEIIFGSWTEKGSNRSGKLTVLDMRGSLLTEVEIPAPRSWGGNSNWNGILGAPTLADIDADSELEVVVGTAFSGLCAYDVTPSRNARVLWRTGRGNYQRTGSRLGPAVLTGLSKRVDPTTAREGDSLRYTINLNALGGDVAVDAWVTDTLPAQVTYAGDLWASAGSYRAGGGVITWTGLVYPGQPVSITFGATVKGLGGAATAVVNQAAIQAAEGYPVTRTAATVINGLECSLPLILKNDR